MKTFFNEMLYYLFCLYRRKDEAFVASFHAKSILSAGLIFYVFIIYLILRISKLLPYKLALPNGKIIIGLIFCLPSYFLIYLITKSNKELELQYHEDDGNYSDMGRSGFYLFFVGGLVIFMTLSVINGGE